MWNRLLLAVTVGAVPVAGCAPQPAPGSQPPTGPTSHVDTVAHGPASHRDPNQLTTALLGHVQGSIYQFELEHGRLPLSIEDVEPYFRETPSASVVDAWGIRFNYRQVGVLYEIRSSGSDQRLFTEDDIIVWGQAGRRAPCMIHLPDGRVFDFSQEPPRCPSIPHEPG